MKSKYGGKNIATFRFVIRFTHSRFPKTEEMKKMRYVCGNLLAVTVFCCIISTQCVQQTQLNEDNLDKPFTKVNVTDGGSQSSASTNLDNAECSSSTIQCKDLKATCLSCKFNYTCVYGAKLNVTCSVKDSNSRCLGEREFKREMICRYCYQTDHWEHSCVQKANCNTVAAPKVYYRTNCSVKDDILCLGRRTFKKNLPCNWTGGYKWSTALIFSVTLGGFGADRFYLGHWQEGIGKLFSFGGLGVWTLIDVILISLRYLGPADGSLYI